MFDYADPLDPRGSADAARAASSARRRRARRFRAPTPAGRRAARECNLAFVSAGANVPLAIVEDSPTLLVAAVEDLCWRFAVQDWSERRPARSEHAAHAAWQAEGRRFDDKRVRIREMVDEALTAS
jgi:hypothetical protein